MKLTAQHIRRLHTGNFIKVSSEAITDIDYDPSKKIIEIAYSGEKIYHYTKMNRKMWDKFLTIIKKKESIGTYINQQFKKMIDEKNIEYYEVIL